MDVEVVGRLEIDPGNPEFESDIIAVEDMAMFAPLSSGR